MKEGEEVKQIYKNSIDIPLHNFSYLQHTSDDRASDRDGGNQHKRIFIGRKKELDKMLSILNQEDAKGAYLVSGYRGCGKTSFINEAIHRYKKLKKAEAEKTKDVVEVRVNLANDSLLDPYKIYKRMAHGLLDNLNEDDLLKSKNKRKNKKDEKKFLHVIHQLSVMAIFILLLSVFFFYINVLVNCESECKGDIFNYKELLVDNKESYVFQFPSLAKSKGFVKIKKETLNPVIYVFFGIIIFIYILFSSYIYHRYSIKINKYRRLEDLVNEIDNDTNSSFQIKSPLSFSRNISKKSIEYADIEHRLSSIINDYNINYDKDIIFIFDELDKITSPKDSDISKEETLNHGGSGKRIERLDKLLSTLKNIVSSNSARFIFIGGRDMHDAFLTQTGAVSSLYQSIFNESIYIPTLLSDDTDGQRYRLHSMIEKLCMAFMLPENEERENNSISLSDYAEEIKKWKGDNELNDNEKEYILYSFFVLRTFINYLTVNSKGNYKVLLRMFYEFVREDNKNKDKKEADYMVPSYINKSGRGESETYQARYYLHFEIKDIQKMLLASNLYISFRYHLSRRLRYADDKLVVASISMLHFIIKFYNKGFSRRHLYNAYDSISSSSRPPELRGITEIIIKKVLTSSLRKSRYCITRYRFTSFFESEVRYISETSSDQSALYNFSLGALSYLKKRFQDRISSINEEQKNHSGSELVNPAAPVKAMHYLSLGDVYFWEQSYDDAASSYSYATEFLRSVGRGNEFVYNQTFMEALLKLGLTFEINHNYSEANNIYLEAKVLAKSIFKETRKKINSLESVYDAKFDYLTQGYWASLFLNIKRSPRSSIQQDIPPYHIKIMYKNCKDVMYYKLGIYHFYIFDLKKSVGYFNKSIFSSKYKDISKLNERSGFLLGRSYLYSALIEVVCKLSSTPPDKYEKFIADELGAFSELCSDMEDKCQCKNSIDGGCQYTADGECKYAIENKYKDYDYAKINNISNVFTKTIVKLLKSKEIFSAVELHTNAVYSYMAIVFVWGLFLESIPSRIVSKINKENCDKYITIYNFIENLCEKSYNESIKTHQKSFAEFVGNYYKEVSSLVANDNKEINPIKLLKSSFSNGILPDSVNRVYWQRSMQGQYLIELYLWQKRAFQSFIGDEAEVIDFNINNFPQFGIRSFSLALVLSGKNKLMHLKSKLRKLPKGNITKKNFDGLLDESIKLTCEAILYFYRATLYISQSSGNEQYVSFPPQSHVYYNMWEILLTLLHYHLELCQKNIYLYEVYMGKIPNNSDQSWKKIASKLQEKLVEYSQDNIEYSNETPIAMYDIDTLQKRAEKHLSKSRVATDCYSKIHKDILYEKYYLQDDYDDPSFFFDIFYFKAFSVPAKLHLQVIKKEMKKLNEYQCPSTHRL